LPKSKLSRPIEPKKPEFKPVNKPQPPSKSDTSFDGCGKHLLYLTAVGAFCLWIGLNSKKGADAMLFGILILVVVLFAVISLIKGNIDDSKNYEAKQRKYDEDLASFPKLARKAEDEYKKAMLAYEENHCKYESELKIYLAHIVKIREPERVKQYRRNELLKYIGQSTKPILKINKTEVLKGVTENYFASELRKIGDFNVHQNFILTFADSESGFYPDIVVEDKETGLLVDIEIDEPYIGSTGEPIHYINCGDEKRDKYFESNGWVVIRFAEEQIIKETEKCVDFVVYVVEAIVKDKIDLGSMSFEELVLAFCSPQKFSTPQWSKDDAHKMAFARYRNRYLGFSLTEKLSTEFLKA
jgi:hypothetical protein